jgi:hypothetical protein
MPPLISKYRDCHPEPRSGEGSICRDTSRTHVPLGVLTSSPRFKPGVVIEVLRDL